MLNLAVPTRKQTRVIPRKEFWPFWGITGIEKRRGTRRTDGTELDKNNYSVRVEINIIELQ
jgi:hypothetical protein